MKTFDAAEIFSQIKEEFQKSIKGSQEMDTERSKPIDHQFDTFFMIKEELYIWFDYHLGHKKVYAIAVTDDDEIEIETDFEQLERLLIECITEIINNK